MPARCGRSSIGCSTSPAPCWKRELCSTLHSRRRRTQLRDTSSLRRRRAAPSSVAAQRRRPGGRSCQGRQPPKAGAMASLNRACRARPTLGCARHRRVIHITHPCTRNGPEKISRGVRKNTCKKVGSPDDPRAPQRTDVVCQLQTFMHSHIRARLHRGRPPSGPAI